MHGLDEAIARLREIQEKARAMPRGERVDFFKHDGEDLALVLTAAEGSLEALLERCEKRGLDVDLQGEFVHGDPYWNAQLRLAGRRQRVNRGYGDTPAAALLSALTEAEGTDA